ncbi:MAG TPA: ABC transporter ATP-binding protein, partial [Thermoleophilaceae bacterium]|nr:ABC transporter ATP-binding protein [Thermoleophilaceae bacterium]
AGPLTAVDGISYSVEPGGALGIVGESGSGKTVSSLAVMGLLRGSNVEISGSALLDGRELVGLSDRELRQVRGNEIAMVFQDPLTSLHPLKRVGAQVAEAVRAHNEVTRAAARARAVELLALVELRDPARSAGAYPHQLSGGMRQRAMIAMALANDPRLLFADEPTTALDVTVQAQILALLDRLREELGMALVIVTHDLGVIARTAERVAVMYAGRIVERAPTRTIFDAPEHPYTWGLLRSIPRLDLPRDVRVVPIEGRPPSLLHRPSGCSFHPRCPHVREAHRRIDPPLEPADGDPEHEVACLLPRATRRELWAQVREGR